MLSSPASASLLGSSHVPLSERSDRNGNFDNRPQRFNQGREFADDGVVEIGNLLRLYANHKRIGKLLVGCEVATFEARIIVDLVAWIIPKNVLSTPSRNVLFVAE